MLPRSSRLLARHNLPGARIGYSWGGNTLCCFSPTVMLATMMIEAALAVWVLFRYRRNRFAMASVGFLVLLSAFQLAEFQICDGRSLHFWSRFGLLVITALPVWSLYLVSIVAQRQAYLRLGYCVAGLSALLIVFLPRQLIYAYCGGNYVTFNSPIPFQIFYAAYYFGFLFLGVAELFKAMNSSDDESQRPLLRWCLAGYLSFLLPMAAVYAAYPPSRGAVPSIMCGFALIMAFILSFQIVPAHARENTSADSLEQAMVNSLDVRRVVHKLD